MGQQYVGHHTVIRGPFAGQKLAGPTLRFTMHGMTGRYRFRDGNLVWFPG